MPWSEFCALIEPYWHERLPVGLERMLRMYFLAGEACEEALYDIALFRDFCQIDLGRDRALDATTLLKFRHLLEAYNLGAALFAKVGEL